MYDANNEHSADDKLTARELSPQSVPINLEANKITKNAKEKEEQEEETKTRILEIQN